MHADTRQTAQWWARPRGEGNAEWIAQYHKSLRASHRDVIVATVQGLPGVTSVLEVGCHCGPNLIRLAQELPSLEQLSGVDINGDAIQAGQQWAASLGLGDRIEFTTGPVADMVDLLPDRCVDVVLSCYTLAYTAPADLDAVLYNLGRVATRAIVLAEPMTDREPQQARLALSGYQEWIHNYTRAVRWLNTWRDCRVTVTAIPPVDRLNAILVADRCMPC